MDLQVRRELWGFSKDESMEPKDMHSIKYLGIRPAPGYPTQPDHTEKETLWKLLDAEKLTGIKVSLKFLFCLIKLHLLSQKKIGFK